MTEQARENREYWEKQVASAARELDVMEPVGSNERNPEWLRRIAALKVNQAIGVIMVEDAANAAALLESAVQIGERGIELVQSDGSTPSGDLVACQWIYQQKMMAEIVMDAEWLLSGQLPESRLQVVSQLGRLAKQTSGLPSDEGSMVSLMLDSLLQGDLVQAVDDYHLELRIRLAFDQRDTEGEAWVPARSALLYCVALSARSDGAEKSAARDAMEIYYQRCCIWGEHWAPILSAGERLRCAYIRAKYFGGDTNPRALLLAMRDT